MNNKRIKLTGSVDISREITLEELDEHAEEFINQFYDRFTVIVENHKEKLIRKKRVMDARFMDYLNTPCSQYSVVPG